MEPERRIEKLLRTYARKRREEAGATPELHPATRRLLHGEVARRAARQAGPGFFRRLLALRGPRLAFAVCGVAAVLAAVLVLPALLRTGTEARFASPGTTSSNPAMRREDLSARQETVPASPAAATRAAAPPALAEPSQPARPPARHIEPSTTTTIAGRVPQSLAVAGTPTGSTSDRMTVAKAASHVFRSEQFVEVNAVSALAGRPVEASARRDAGGRILSSFRFEQNGNEIRIVDSDGSIYTGRWQTVAALAADQPVAAAGAGLESGTNLSSMERLDRKKAELSQPVYSFRVAGTNRTLNQAVVFTGRLVTITNAEWYASTAATNRTLPGERTLQWSSSSTAKSPLANSRISGTVLIEHRLEIQIDAIPAKP